MEYQAMIAILDYGLRNVHAFANIYKLMNHNGRRETGLSLIDYVKKAEGLGAGEVVINSID